MLHVHNLVSVAAACEVQFGPAEYVRNDVACSDEARLSISSGATYVPRCQTGDSSLYESCQCDIGASLSLAKCWCSDAQGNALDSQVQQFNSDKASLQEVCAGVLSCANAEEVPDASGDSPTYDMDELLRLHEENLERLGLKAETGDNSAQIVHVMVAAIAAMCLGVGLLAGNRWIRAPQSVERFKEYGPSIDL